MQNLKKLGSLQTDILKSLILHKGWQERCGWVWKNTGVTKRTLDSLEKIGCVRCEDGFYTPIHDENGNAIETTVTKE